MNNVSLILVYFSFLRGKLGEKVLRPTTVFLSSYGELINLAADPFIHLMSVIPLDEELLQVRYMPVSEMEDSLPTTSLVHAAMTTSLGRVLLYSFMDIVGDRTLYHDTGK